MTKFLVIFYGGASEAEKAAPMSEEARQDFMAAWMKWASDHKEAIVDNGGPLSHARSVKPGAVSVVENDMTAFSLVQAESSSTAAGIFSNHPHLSLHPKNPIEVVEIKPVPTR